MLGRDDDDDLAVTVVLWMSGGSERPAVARGQGFRIARELIDDPVGRPAGVNGDGALFFREAALHVEGVPVAALFEFSEAKGVLTGLAEGGAIDLSRPASAHVSHDQLNCPPDGGIRAVALPKDVHLVVHADSVANRAVDHDHRRGKVGGGKDPVHVELLGGDGFDHGDDDRKVVGLAAGHDGVDCDLLDGHRGQVRRHHGDHLLGVAFRAREHAHHALGGRRDDRQTIRQALIEHEFEDIVGLAYLDPAGADWAAFHLRREPFSDARLNRLRAAARPPLGVGGPVHNWRWRERNRD